MTTYKFLVDGLSGLPLPDDDYRDHREWIEQALMDAAEGYGDCYPSKVELDGNVVTLTYVNEYGHGNLRCLDRACREYMRTRGGLLEELLESALHEMTGDDSSAVVRI